MAKPRFGTGNLVNDQFYKVLESNYPVTVIDWTPVRMLSGRYDILHIHWPDNILAERASLKVFFKICALMVSLAWVRVLGRKVVWTCHNLASHDLYHPGLEKIFWYILVRLLSGVIALSEENLKAAIDSHPALKRKNNSVIHHGHYVDLYPNSASRHESRKKLGLPSNSKVVLCLGIIRPYKQIEKLINNADSLQGLVIVIAGESRDKRYSDWLVSLAEGKNNVLLRIKFIEDSELQFFFNSADLFVLPYSRITNSGSAILALSFGVPVLAPGLSCFQSLRRSFNSSWVFCYEGDFDSKHITDYFENVPGSRNPIEWGEYSWDKIAAKAYAFFKNISGKVDL